MRLMYFPSPRVFTEMVYLVSVRVGVLTPSVLFCFVSLARITVAAFLVLVSYTVGARS